MNTANTALASSLTHVSPSDSTPVRETPAVALFVHAPGDPAFPNVGDPTNPDPNLFEETLALDIIQGNVIDGGFNKDFQTILCLKITDGDHFKLWLKEQIRFISTAEDVLTFNRLFKKIRNRRGEPTGLQATWVNISFSFRAIELLTDTTEANKFIDQAFKDGLAAHATELGDPTSHDAEGNPHKWVMGGTHHPVHVLMLVAADLRCDMLAEVARIEESIYHFRIGGHHASSGAQIIFREEGANLPAPLSGHEHFGNLDGVSQPGVRGRISEDSTDVLTLRQNPEKVDAEGHRTQGKPGQELLWPGEFVFGYPGQNPDADDLAKSKGEVKKAIATTADHWTDNGSFLVFRRLRQDVFKFHEFLGAQAKTLTTDPLLLSSKLVGRWESGAPTVRNPDMDQPAMGSDDCANNDFEFNAGTDTPDINSGPNDCIDIFPGDPKDDATAAPGDEAATGRRCPFTAHTRKAYPRNDLTLEGVDPVTGKATPDKSEVHTQTHRMLRRGIPFGPVSSSTPAEPIDDTVDRGLHFLAYQTSIEKQFEFVTKNWVNNPNFSTEAATDHECGGVLPLGHDPVIGQSENGGVRTRKFFVELTDETGIDRCEELTAPEDWVIPTGGGYFFTPSIDALKNTLT